MGKIGKSMVGTNNSPHATEKPRTCPRFFFYLVLKNYLLAKLHGCTVSQNLSCSSHDLRRSVPGTQNSISSHRLSFNQHTASGFCSSIILRNDITFDLTPYP